MKNNLLVITLVITGLAGCSFPQMEARAKAKALDEKGYHREAENLRDKSNDLNSSDINLDGKGLYRPDSDYDPRNDPPHFPELKKSQEQSK